MDHVIMALWASVPQTRCAPERRWMIPKPAIAALLIAALAFLSLPASLGRAAPALTIDASSGAVLYEEQGAVPWYPASLTKMMTAYVALKAVRDRKISLDTPFMVSARAAAMPPSKMGFKPGTLVTLDNALKMLMVKSANDIAVTIAEGVSGSIEAFAEDMNAAASSLGLQQSHFVNPNGLPHPRHVSSARDMAILARALYLQFPDYAGFFGIGALRLGDMIIRNHNNLLGRYPGADGVKTGFTCAAGFNIAASASQGGRMIIAVVLGAPSVESRTIKTAALFDRAFAGIDRPSGSVMSLTAPATQPPDMRSTVCHKRGKAVAEFNAGTERLIGPLTARTDPAPSALEQAYGGDALDRAVPMALRIGMVPPPAFDPLPIQIGAPATYTGPIAQARPPHSPIGTEPAFGASAYAAVPETSFIPGGPPLAPDDAALPLRAPGKPAPAAKGKAPQKAKPAIRPTTKSAPAKTTANSKAHAATTSKAAPPAKPGSATPAASKVQAEVKADAPKPPRR
jgi:D-alanyl-D-alanine carboxypeptidase